jgi:hypothetical protein
LGKAASSSGMKISLRKRNAMGPACWAQRIGG